MARRAIGRTGRLLVLGAALSGATAQAQGKFPPDALKNVQALPEGTTVKQVVETMRGFTRALGVRCNHCHVVTAMTPKEEFDFASDAKDEKKNARTMILMTRAINKSWVPRVAADAHVGCWTCHRGKPEPESPPPPPGPPKS